VRIGHLCLLKYLRRRPLHDTEGIAVQSMPPPLDHPAAATGLGWTPSPPTAGNSSRSVEEDPGLRWSALGLTVIIVATAAGNLLVCLAVCLERRLQNITNYFLMSLSIADLLVSLLVMPLGMVVELFGR